MKTAINEEYEYKKHRVFGSLTKCLSIISLISLILLILKIIIDRDYKVIVNYGSIWTIFYTDYTVYRLFSKQR